MSSCQSRRSFLRRSAQLVLVSGFWLSGCGGGGESPQPAVGGAVVFGQEVQTLEHSILQFAEDGTVFRLGFFTRTVTKLSQDDQSVWVAGGLSNPILNSPVALVAGTEGEIFVADRGNSEVLVLDSDGRKLRSFGGEVLRSARALAIDQVNKVLYLADASGHRIVAFDFQGRVQRIIGEFGFEDSELNFPTGLVIAADGNLHVVDQGNSTVKVYTPQGRFERNYGFLGDDLGGLNTPRSIVADRENNTLVADGVAGFITVFDSTGRAIGRFKPAGPRGFVQPRHLSLDGNGDLFVEGQIT